MPDTHVLVVEGPDDSNLFFHLLTRLGIPISERGQGQTGKIRIVAEDGIDQLLESLGVWLKGSELKYLGVVFDADTDLGARWMSLTATLRTAGYHDIPAQPDPRGTILRHDDRPTIGVWLMPDNLSTGMLEHFVRALVPMGDHLWPLAADCVHQIPVEERRFPLQHQIKAELHTWLAWQEEPGKPMGQAVTKRYLDVEAPQAQQLIAWIRRLFAL